MAENSFYYDGSLCIGCRSCQVACKQWHGLPAEKTEFFAAPGGYQNPRGLSAQTWTLIRFQEVPKQGRVDWLFRRDHCFHCTNAACIEVCPVEPKAMSRHPDFKTVFVSQERCIGCGACELACPHGAPHLNDDTGTSRKCEGCFDRVGNGLLPACAKTCPTRAIRYGPRDEIYALADKRMEELRAQGFQDANVYGPKQNGGLHSICVLPAKLEVYGLSKEPKLGNLEPIRRYAKDRYAAWRLERGVKMALAGGGGPTGLAFTLGLAVGLKKLADRKEALAGDRKAGPESRGISELVQRDQSSSETWKNTA